MTLTASALIDVIDCLSKKHDENFKRHLRLYDLITAMASRRHSGRKHLFDIKRMIRWQAKLDEDRWRLLGYHNALHDMRKLRNRLIGIERFAP